MSMASPPPAEHKTWFRVLKSRIDDSARVHAYHDEPGRQKIAIFTGRIGSDWIGATVGLMDVNQGRKDATNVHTEVLMERHGSDEALGNILSTIAFFSIKDEWKIAPGVVFEKLVAMYLPDCPLPHVMFVPIFRWDDMARVELNSKVVFPLLAIPISQTESDFVTREGADALTELLEAASTDVNNWQRASVA